MSDDEVEDVTRFVATGPVFAGEPEDLGAWVVVRQPERADLGNEYWNDIRENEAATIVGMPLSPDQQEQYYALGELSGW